MNPNFRSNDVIVNRPKDEVRSLLAQHYSEAVARRGMRVNVNEATRCIDIAAEYLTSASPKQWLFLSGNVGTGKTTLLYAIGKTLTDCNVLWRMFPASDFPKLFLNNVEQTERQLLRGDWCKVLLLDDIGVGQTEIKEYGNIVQPFIKIVEERYNRRLPLIVSTNLDGSAMIERYGQRAADRIKEMAVAIKYEGKSFRK